MQPNELTVAVSAGPSPRGGWPTFPPAVEKKIEALAAKLEAAWQDVPEGQLWEPDAGLQQEMDDLGTLTRDTLARAQKCHRGDTFKRPHRRPRRESRRRRSVRTRRAKARAPSGDPSPEPEPPLDLLDAAVLALRMGASVSGIVLPKISTPEQATSEALRLRVLAYMNGAPSSQELRKKAAKKKAAA